MHAKKAKAAIWSGAEVIANGVTRDRRTSKTRNDGFVRDANATYGLHLSVCAKECHNPVGRFRPAGRSVRRYFAGGIGAIGPSADVKRTFGLLPSII